MSYVIVKERFRKIKLNQIKTASITFPPLLGQNVGIDLE